MSPKTNPYYPKVIEAIGKPALFEKAKILYLIGQIRLSSLGFERNRTVFKGPQAAAHLLRKYGVSQNRIATAEQFIEQLASKSSFTGKPYYGIDSLGDKHALKDVLSYELFLLERKLRAAELHRVRP